MLAHHTASAPSGAERCVSDMRNYKHYTRYDRESKAFTVVAVIVLLGLIAFFALTMAGMFDEPLWKPDGSYPIVNANVSWQQTFHGGAF